MKKPNFLIIGAAKAGTTSLYTALSQHPQVYMSPVKEPNFFAFEGQNLNFPNGTISPTYLASCKTNIDAYRELFDSVSTEIAVGEASPSYLYYPQAAERIYKFNPDTKIIAVLRDPVERAYSTFLHHAQRSFETTDSFVEALDQEENRRKNNWWWSFSYIQGGLYYQQIKRYFDRFDHDQIKVYLYKDLTFDFNGLLKNLFEFIEVDPSYLPKPQPRYNSTGIPKKLWLHQFLSQANPIKTILKPLFPVQMRKPILENLKSSNLKKPIMDSELRLQLIQLYHEDIHKLQDLMGRDLSNWLN